MNIFYEDALLILRKMLEKQVNFILIGGYAVNYYGYNRVTGDLDIWLKPNNDNKVLLVSGLAELGFDRSGLDIISSCDFTKPQMFHIGNQPDKTDFMTFISGVKYEEGNKLALNTVIDGLPLKMIYIQHLIKNKTASERLKHLADVEYLSKISKLRKKK